MRTYGVEHIPTKPLRWLRVNLAMVKSRSLRDFRRAVECELLARDLPSIADESGGYLVAPILKVQ